MKLISGATVEDRYKKKDIRRDLPYKSEVYYKILKIKKKGTKKVVIGHKGGLIIWRRLQISINKVLLERQF